MLLSFRNMDEQTNTKHNNEIFEAVKKETEPKSSENNPWHMTSISDFLFYCCAECNFKDKNEENFILHAKAHHPKFLEMFVNNKDLVLPKSDLKEDEFNDEPNENVESDSEENVDKKEVFYEVISQVVGDVRFKCCFCDYKRIWKTGLIK